LYFQWEVDYDNSGSWNNNPYGVISANKARYLLYNTLNKHIKPKENSKTWIKK
jgi:hypothetical protein